MAQKAIQLDDSGNPIYEALDDNGVPILHQESTTRDQTLQTNPLNKPLLSTSGPFKGLSDNEASNLFSPVSDFFSGLMYDPINALPESTAGKIGVGLGTLAGGFGAIKGVSALKNRLKPAATGTVKIAEEILPKAKPKFRANLDGTFTPAGEVPLPNTGVAKKLLEQHKGLEAERILNRPPDLETLKGTSPDILNTVKSPQGELPLEMNASVKPNFGQTGRSKAEIDELLSGKSEIPSLYHGTRSEFTNFEPGKGGSGWGNFKNWTSFTENPEYAKLYSEGKFGSMKREMDTTKGIPRIIEAKVKPNNVLDLTKPLSESDVNKFYSAYDKAFPGNKIPRSSDPAFVSDLAKQSYESLPYDAIKFTEHGQTNWAVSPKLNIEQGGNRAIIGKGTPTKEGYQNLPNETKSQFLKNTFGLDDTGQPIPNMVQSGKVPPTTPPNKPFNPDNFNPDEYHIISRKNPEYQKPGLFKQIWDIPKEMMATDLPYITSASFRQGTNHLGSKPWLEAFQKSAKAYGDKGAADLMEAQQLARPLFKPQYKEIKNAAGLPVMRNGKPVIKEMPSFAEQAGLRRNLFDERAAESLAEKIPFYGQHLKASNRQFKAFTNHIGDTVFEQMVDDYTKLGRDPRKDLVLGREIADLINVSLKRGNVAPGKLDKIVTTVANNLMWSPRNVASELQGPKFFFSKEPAIRQKYLEMNARRLGMWVTVAGMAKLAGADVSLDPTNPDFGKIKLGSHRIDLPGGLQQFIVFAAQQAAGGKTSSNNPSKFTEYGSGYGSQTRAEHAGSFLMNRAHPTVDYLKDLGSATQRDPVGAIDRTLQLGNPMFNSDVKQVLEKNPELMPLLSLINSLGMGTQTYEKGDKFNAPKILPNKYDIMIGGR